MLVIAEPPTVCLPWTAPRKGCAMRATRPCRECYLRGEVDASGDGAGPADSLHQDTSMISALLCRRGRVGKDGSDEIATATAHDDVDWQVVPWGRSAGSDPNSAFAPARRAY